MQPNLWMAGHLNSINPYLENMKRLLPLISIIVITLSVSAQSVLTQHGWRPGEMEAKVVLNTPEDVLLLKSLNLMTEPASFGMPMKAWVYMTPAEQEKLNASGLVYEITIPDLNVHSQNIWSDGSRDSYHNYNELLELADSLATNFPAICQKIVLGTTPQSRQLITLKISDNVTIDENEAECLFDGAIHGNEIMGPELLIRWARELCLGYGNDPVYTDLINNREIWLYYLVNPDGFVNGSRYNSNGVDLNRDIGFMWGGEGYSPAPFSQPETKILRDLWLDNQFVLYQNYHGGTEEISLPWSYSGLEPPDYDHIYELAGAYSSTSGYSYFPYGQGWYTMYQIFGATKDFQLGALGQVSWSNEITNYKEPPASQIAMYYNYNVPALTEMVERIGWGVEGMITDSVTGSPVRAAVFVGDFYPVYTDPVVGDYHKYVLPGTYTITVKASGYETKTVTGVVVGNETSAVTDIELAPAEGRYAYRITTVEIPYYPESPVLYADESYVPGLVGPPDNINYSLGRSGYVIIDMGDTIFNGAGADFKVYEGDTSPEGYFIHVAQDKDGPWISLGNGNGTHQFDLSGGTLNSCRYIKITDDGDGQSNAADAGFDLDAIEILTPPLIADFTTTNNTPCQGTGINFSDESTGSPTNWYWEFPGGTPATSTQQNPANIVYASQGTYDVSLTIQNSFTTVSITKTGFIHVAGMPEAPSTPEGPENPCQNALSAYTTTGAVTATSFTWVVYPGNAGTVSGAWMTGTVDWNNEFTGEAWIKVNEVNSCGISPWSDSLAVMVHAAPDIELGPDTLICPEEILILDAGNPGCTYEWSTGATTQTIQVDSATFGLGTHTIWAMVINGEPCTDFDTIVVTIDACTGIAEPASETKVHLWPNPNNGTFVVSVNGIRNGMLEIYNTKGIRVYQENILQTPCQKEISLPMLPQGLYLMRVQSADQTIMQKVIIQ